jgi:CRP-like cAMP-binding protein
VPGVTAVVVAEIFPEMVAGVDPRHRRHAEESTIAAVLRLRPGAWAPDATLEGAPGHFGLLVLDGLLARRVHVGRRACVELLGSGDLLRPWAGAGDGSSIDIDARWVVQEETSLAVLDAAFAARVARYPQIASWLMDRAVRRAHWLAFHLAVGQVTQLQTRLHLMFWYLADRWGRVTPEGIVIPLQLTHNLLGGLVGAHRPATTTALGELASRGIVQRRADGTWLLRGERPAELQVIQGPAPIVR